tara:strand:- start:375 stop:590 length:216 start_codon:yes stop_codon:yes gene_type:complete
MKELKQYIDIELKSLDRGIVATPTQEYLEQFAEANGGSNDFLLMQLAKNFGYKLAMLNIDDKIIRINRKNE